MTLAKYFWELNEKALKETERIIKNPKHHKFFVRMVTLLSRCDQPKVLFSVISKKGFIDVWPRLRSYWIKMERQSDFRDWWETIYEGLLPAYKLKQKRLQGKSPVLFLKIGRLIKEARIQKRLSQKELALMVNMKQPDISKIEEGKKNATLETLFRLCNVLGIKRIDLK